MSTKLQKQVKDLQKKYRRNVAIHDAQDTALYNELVYKNRFLALIKSGVDIKNIPSIIQHETKEKSKNLKQKLKEIRSGLASRTRNPHS